MNKIILGYEKYDANTTEGWNFNGRVISSELLKKFSPSNPWLDDIYKTIIEPEKFPNSYKYHPQLFENVDSVINLPVNEIASNDIYFYPILIISIGLYTGYIKTIEISQKVRNDVLNKKAYIIFIYDNEGDLRYRYEIFNNLVVDLNLPKEQIIVFHGDFDSEYFKDSSFTYKPILYWNEVFPQITENSGILTYEHKKLFLSYNRTIRTHKQLMLSGIIKNKLLIDGIISCGKLFPIDSLLNSYNYSLSTEEKNQLKNLELTSPDNNIKDNQIVNDVHSMPYKEYSSTFVSLVTETLPTGCFYSEKTFKPIAIGHPFILFGAKGQLKYLKEIGYKSFDQYWNEDYDDEGDLITRIEKICKILIYLKNKNLNDLVKIREKMFDILLHNQQFFLTQQTKFFRQRVFSELIKILESKKS